MTPCIGEPISWMRLERYGLSQVSAAEQQSIASHLGECPACRACFERIEHGEEVLRLPLPAAVAVARPPRREPRLTWRNLGSWGLVASGALAALVLLARHPNTESVPNHGPNTKGGALALELVRMGADGQLREPSHFSPDDRWKARLSCPPGLEGTAELVVSQAGQKFSPLAAQAIEHCGNGVLLQGAFRLDGRSPVTVCVVLSGQRVCRELVASP